MPTWLSPDQCRLYFEKRDLGMEYDLFVAEREA